MYRLIRKALEDLEKCRRDPDYEIDFLSWHQPHHGVCRVCLAGAYLAKTLGANPRYKVNPRVEEDVEMFFLNSVRQRLDRVQLEAYLGPMNWEGYPKPHLCVEKTSDIGVLYERADWFENYFRCRNVGPTPPELAESDRSDQDGLSS